MALVSLGARCLGWSRARGCGGEPAAPQRRAGRLRADVSSDPRVLIYRKALAAAQGNAGTGTVIQAKYGPSHPRRTVV